MSEPGEDIVSVSDYTVKQVADLTGVPATTLRAWERRYQVVHPERTTSRYRLYSDDDVSRLRRMAQLIRHGTPASLAAERVSGRPIPRSSATTAPRTPPPPGAFIDAATSFDGPAMERLLDLAFTQVSFESAFEDCLVPALHAIGEEWQRGSASVAAEHFLSGAIARRLATWFEAAEPDPGRATVLVGLPSGARHEIGALALATCVRRLQHPVCYLGADVPQSCWEGPSRTAGAVVVSVPTDADLTATAGLLDRLQSEQMSARTPIYVGGGGAAKLELPPEVHHLTGNVSQSAATVVASLTSENG